MRDVSSVIALGQQTAARLIAQQFPELSDKEIRHQANLGTDNHIFRIGRDLCARFPKAPWAAGTAKREAAALPRFAGAPLAVPEVYGLGKPGAAYPHEWSVLSWLPGTPLEDGALSDPSGAAHRLADFFTFLRHVPPADGFSAGAGNNGRGAPLETRTLKFEAALARLPEIGALWAKRLWAGAIRAESSSDSVWLHGDVHPGNALVEDGRITGIIDWGLCGIGDGACDLLSAWAMFEAGPRDVFRKAAEASEAEWLRGAGWALSMAVIYLPFAYENGLRTDMSETMIRRLKEEFA